MAIKQRGVQRANLLKKVKEDPWAFGDCWHSCKQGGGDAPSPPHSLCRGHTRANPLRIPCGSPVEPLRIPCGTPKVYALTPGGSSKSPVDPRWIPCGSPLVYALTPGGSSGDPQEDSTIYYSVIPALRLSLFLCLGRESSGATPIDLLLCCSVPCFFFKTLQPACNNSPFFFDIRSDTEREREKERERSLDLKIKKKCFWNEKCN